MTGELFTYHQLTERFGGVTTKTIYRWFRHCPKFRRGNIVLIPAVEVEKLIRESTQRRTPVRRTARPSVRASK
jgi:hypothetical protein